MSLKNLNKYILENICEYFSKITFMEIIRYNKQLMSKLSITKYTYQKYFFNKIITPTYLENLSMLKKYFDEKIINKLKSEWDKENELIDFSSEEKSNNNKVKSNIINIFKESKLTFDSLVNSKISDLTELNISDIGFIKLPCSIIFNVQKLSLENLRIKFISNESNISLNKLIQLKMNNITIDENKGIAINMNNLKYLYITIKDLDLENNDNALYYYGFYSNIFGFDFINMFLENIGDDERKCARKFFQKKYLNNFKYINLKIYMEPKSIRDCTGSQQTDTYYYFGGYDYNYIFSQTKGNKYYFETKFIKGDNHEYEIKEKEIRYCSDINYNNYYFNNRKISIWDVDERYGLGDIFKDLNKLKIKSVEVDVHKIVSLQKIKVGEDDEYSSTLEIDSRNLLKLFKSVKSDNKLLEIISIGVLDAKCYPKFIDKIKYFLELKCFYVTDDCIMSNSQLMKLLDNLSSLKNLFEIQINSEKKLNLNKNEKDNIKKIFPKIDIKKKCIEWKRI